MTLTITKILVLLAAPLLASAAPWPRPKTVTPPSQPELNLFARGTQNYICDASQGKWLLLGADAPLWDQHGNEVGRHFFVDAVPHWQLHSDSSFIATKAVIPIPSPHGPTENIPWVMTQKAWSSQSGKMSEINFVARIDTEGGVAPPNEWCHWEADGKEYRKEYAARYLFAK
ncbi:uncharacterized protein SPPG_08255 [Spizellomyces punctatus DAOM BR117]|uniref:Uncharacterized protein n=1 Tax=Spizellomyces punctatus (strain DAOM BR117) TaxID=645134 RepID=A0A0L0H5V1_SPIPD|nr:uncharacterized protein SPPG_08255 [Spizellomyces punctatus DAOM BR117]KNC96354.1 hypothetical protein SPPG_08255 [Spizellomyces punctatus DAOM BR117]|eukprot:XP_016604394.1 hypothetical protein SPPG_08255 [Spizellomyces punctatus DAOM BR117]